MLFSLSSQFLQYQVFALHNQYLFWSARQHSQQNITKTNLRWMSIRILTILCQASSFEFYFNVKYCTVPIVFVLSVWKRSFLWCLVSKLLPEEAVKPPNDVVGLIHIHKVLPSWLTYQLCFTKSSVSFGLWGCSSRFEAWGKSSICFAIIVLHDKANKRKKITVTIQIKMIVFSEHL